ncbi:MAG TPA: flagellar filament capping protein FliD [Pirellulales bacterium]|nr:flagellar filament capping protein FliD [Pirellulales bacterium]
MGRITAGVGLISGLPISQLVTQLLSFDAQPVTDLQNQVTTEKNQQTALLDLSTKLLALQNDAESLSSPNVLSARQATSSNPSAVTATAGPSTPLATYQVTPIAQAQTQQLLSNGFSDSTTATIGAGTITIKRGGFVNPSTSLAQLNGGQGVARGAITITDRSGASATIDLTAAQTIDDVVNAINQATGIHVQASVNGDGLVLTDKTGQTAANLSVQNVGNDTTAADLGLAGSVASSTLTGTNIVSLSGSTQLSSLNDGNGVRKAASVPDFRITLKNNTTLAVDLGSSTTLQNAVDAINNATGNGGSLVASISGTHLVLTDNTGGAGTLSVSALNGSQAAADLGILGNEQGGGVLAGKRIISGLDTVLLQDVNGGAGITTQGQVQLTDRSGATATINLSSAATLNDVLTAINGAGLGLKASVNAAGDGVQISDTTGSTASNLIIADTGGGTTAADLHIAANSAANSVNSGDSNVRYISENTQLSTLNGGAGIQAGKFQITDSSGKAATIDLTGANIHTIGDVLQAINTSGIGVGAAINSTGDGILLTDTAGGSGTMQVADLGGGSAASDLNLAGSATGGKIDGAFRYNVTVTSTDTLSSVQQEFVNAKAPVYLNVIDNGGSSKPYQLMLGSTSSGTAGRLLIDTGATGLSFSTLTPPADAVLQVGSAGSGNLVFTSGTNTFSSILPGLSVNVTGVSSTPVTLTVGQDTQPLVAAIQQFAQDFNTVSSTISQDDSYDPTTQKGSVLQGDLTVQQIQNTIFNAVTDLAGSGSDKTRSLMQMGITFTGGQLSVNADALQAAITNDPSGVQDFLSNATSGMATQLDTALKGFTDQYTGTIQQRVNTFNQAISDQQDRINFLNAQLDAKKTLLLDQFNQMESALATLQAQSSQVAQLANLVGLASGSSGGSSSSSGSSGSSSSSGGSSSTGG